jgi:hypothetical protein
MIIIILEDYSASIITAEIWMDDNIFMNLLLPGLKVETWVYVPPGEYKIKEGPTNL